MIRRLLVIATVMVVAAAGGAFWYVTHLPLNTPREVLAAYVARWQAEDFQGMRALVAGPPPTFVATHAQMVKDLGVSSIQLTAGPLQVTGTARAAGYSAVLTLKGLGTWPYEGTIHLARFKRRWKVVWSPQTLMPQLGEGQRFVFSYAWDQRAPILGRDGSVLQASVPATAVGVEPAKIVDLAAVTAALQQYAGVAPASVTKALQAPGVQPTWFLPLTTLPPAQFNAVKAQLSPVPGILFVTSSARVPSNIGSAASVLGTTGPVTGERLAQLGSPYNAASVVGLSGLEQAYERQLAGTPSTDIQVLDAAGKLVASVFHFAGGAPQPVQTTLDSTIQAAADAAFTGVTQTAALVAMDAATGEIRAVVNRPSGGFDRAISGSYPPGSTFKIVTTAALLAKGLTLNSPITCPTSTVVDGRTFKNFEGEQLGPINLGQAFAFSCNTAYVQMAATLKPAQLKAAAESLGFNTPEPLGLTSPGGSFPPLRDLAAQAEAAIGQAQVLTSPVHMASVAAAVASGAWHQPVLVANTTATVRPLDPTVAAQLRTAMGLVVTEGTGTAAQLPGTPVVGKTGTAEFGNANPPLTHAWFVGFRGNLAFAVIVEAGGVGGRVAAPLAAKFLSSLPGG